MVRRRSPCSDVASIIHEPRILGALNPWHGAAFFIANRHVAFLTLGAVVLAVTGAEALYADMGHFGKRPIRVAWFSLVLPALVLNYLGQGALLLRNPAATSNPFFFLAPRVMLLPLVVLATVAAVIASQALISGAFSLTQQAVQLGYSPRITVVHTSANEAGQIFIPEINRLLMFGCVLLVIAFKNSNSLGAAYGIAVTGTMAITSLLFYVVARGRWNWSLWHILPITLAFLAIDLTLFVGERHQDRAWRLGADRHRGGRVHADEHVEEGTPPAQSRAAFRLASARSLPRRRRASQTGPRSGNRGVHDVVERRRARRAPASPQAQQGAARAGHSHVGRDATRCPRSKPRSA